MRFIRSVFTVFFALLLVQQPLFLLYGGRAYAGFSAADWIQMVASVGFFNLMLAGSLTLLPLLVSLLSERIPRSVSVGILKAYFLIASLVLAFEFARAISTFDQPLLCLILFVVFAGSMLALFWERVVPMFGPLSPPSRVRYSLLGVVWLLALPLWGGLLASHSDRAYAGNEPGLSYLAVNPYFHMVYSLGGNTASVP